MFFEPVHHLALLGRKPGGFDHAKPLEHWNLPGCFPLLRRRMEADDSKSAGAELLLEVIATAYERDRLVVTPNLPFENWTEVLGSDRLTGAALDRLTHRCRILETKRERHRPQDAKRRRRPD